MKRQVKILLLGAGESGKSTFLKQMRIIHGQDFDQGAKEEFRATIFSNVIKGTRYILWGDLCWTSETLLNSFFEVKVVKSVAKLRGSRVS